MKQKSILKNSLYNAIYKGFTVLFPLVTTSYISRVLLPEGVGSVAYANTIVLYFVTIAALGIPNYGIKAIAQSAGEERDRTFVELLVINFCSTSLCIIAYYLFVSTAAHFSGERSLFYIMGILLILNYFNIDWFYQGIEEYGYIATRSIVIKILSFAAMLLFVRTREDYLKYALILCAATAGNYVLNAVHAGRYVRFRKYRLDLSRHMKAVLILLGSTIATEIYTMLDTVMLEYFYGKSYVGYYSNSVKIIRLVYTVSISLVATFYPRISYYIKQMDYRRCEDLLAKGFKTVILLAFPAAVGLALLADSIVLFLFGEPFMPATGTIRILSVLVIVFSTAYLLGHIVLMAAGREKTIFYATLCGAGSNAVINALLIPPLRHYGAAIASVAAELIVTTILVVNGRKICPIRIDRHYWGSLIISLLGMTAAVLLVRNFLPLRGTLLLASAIVAAVAVYGLLLVATRNEIVEFFIDKFRSRL